MIIIPLSAALTCTSLPVLLILALALITKLLIVPAFSTLAVELIVALVTEVFSEIVTLEPEFNSRFPIVLFPLTVKLTPLSTFTTSAIISFNTTFVVALPVTITPAV